MISKAYSSFFRELKENNHKAWFHANKKRYEEDVKIPFLNLLEALIPTLREWDARISPDAKKALFRINRDIRFAKDKSPYHTIMKAGFSPGGKKSELPGYYLGIDAENVHVGGGLFMMQPPDLKQVRATIAKDLDTFLSIVESKSFISTFGKLKGEKSKRLDKDLQAAGEKTDFIFHKQFYAMVEFPLKPFYESQKLAEEIREHFQGIKPLNSFLLNALT